MGRPVVARVYEGTFFADLTGQPVKAADLADRLAISTATMRSIIKYSSRIRESGTIIDDDIRKHLGGEKIQENQCKEYAPHRALMSRVWR